MNSILIKISKGQHLSSVYPKIESNVILCKCLPGIGATYSEIKSKRNSIIIVPNLPAISCKCAIHKKDNLFGVKEGVRTENIVKYLEETKESKNYIKLITTPESFYKIKNAFSELEIDFYTSCFLLMDESHKLIKDRDYRVDIVLPMDDFFRFDEKALVSATPIIPRDPRFVEQNFKLVEIVPDFHYKKEIDIIHTNNMLQCISEVIPLMKEQQNPKRSICLFINSTDMILQFIRKLNIEEQSRVFCSEKSMSKLKSLGYKRVHADWKPSLNAPYMFFTSRFYNALDIIMDEKPDIVFVTEPYFAEYTMVDPMTDVVQAVGRFRNGVSSVTHIITTKSSIPIRTEEGLLEFIDASEHAYNIIQTLYKSSKSTEERNAYKIAMQSLPYYSMLRNSKKDWFAIDNYINDEIVKSSYSSLDLIINRYMESGYFSIKSVSHVLYKFGEHERLALFTTVKWTKELRKNIVKILDNIKDDMGSPLFDSFVEELRERDADIVNAYFSLGKEIIEQNGYRMKRLRELMIIKDYQETRNSEGFRNALLNYFEKGKKYISRNAVEKVAELHKTFGVKYPGKENIHTLEEYFKVQGNQRIGTKRAIRILDYKI